MVRGRLASYSHPGPQTRQVEALGLALCDAGAEGRDRANVGGLQAERAGDAVRKLLGKPTHETTTSASESLLSPEG